MLVMRCGAALLAVSFYLSCGQYQKSSRSTRPFSDCLRRAFQRACKGWAARRFPSLKVHRIWSTFPDPEKLDHARPSRNPRKNIRRVLAYRSARSERLCLVTNSSFRAFNCFRLVFDFLPNAGEQVVCVVIPLHEISAFAKPLGYS